MEYFDLLMAIYYHGRKVEVGGKVIKELLNQDLEIYPAGNFISTSESRPLAQVFEYEKAELAWYFSGNTDPSYIIPHAKLWDKIRNPDGTINSNYGNLVFYKEREDKLPSFEFAYKSFLADKNTRQGTMTYNDGSANYIGVKDYICSQVQDFIIRDNILHCFVYLRSSDAIWGLQYNMPWWSIVHQNLRLKLLKKYEDLVLGKVVVKIKSAHIYENHFNLVDKMLSEQKQYNRITLNSEIPLGNKESWYEDNLLSLISLREYSNG